MTVSSSVHTGGASRHLLSYADGEAIFIQGAEGDEMYIVQEGRVEILLRAEDGSDVSLAILERGDFFGEMSVLDGTPRTASARAKGGCKVLPLRGALFTEMLQRDPETTLRIMRKLCGRIRELQSRLAELVDDRRSFIGEAPPAPPQVPPTPAPQPVSARLVHVSGASIDLPPVAEARVGRPDPAVGSVPDIDLTGLAEGRTVSRSHARVLAREGMLYVVAETGATNGTFVNGERLEPGVPRELRDGDAVTFGTAPFTFRIR
jgi:CRP-like cAMP-binding protein